MHNLVFADEAQRDQTERRQVTENLAGEDGRKARRQVDLRKLPSHTLVLGTHCSGHGDGSWSFKVEHEFLCDPRPGNLLSNSSLNFSIKTNF